MTDIVFSNQNIMVYLFVVGLVINYQICDLRLNLNRACCVPPFCVMRTGIGCIHLSFFCGYSRPGAFLERKERTSRRHVPLFVAVLMGLHRHGHRIKIYSRTAIFVGDAFCYIVLILHIAINSSSIRLVSKHFYDQNEQYSRNKPYVCQLRMQ